MLLCKFYKTHARPINTTADFGIFIRLNYVPSDIRYNIFCTC